MDVFDLNAIIRLIDGEYIKGLDDDAAKGESWVSKMGGVFGKFAKIAGAGLAAGAGAVATLGKQAIEAYANYEQLVGGVETLFGAGGKNLEEYAESVGKTAGEVREEYQALMAAQDAVMKNASEAYKTAGLSASEYMETVTSFSASLLQSLGGDTVKAADYADMAIRDMSDNANKMGTSMEAIQTAYAGFSKQNYTMLDNLKLGYGGTKEEMERLIRDAEKLDDSFTVTHTKGKKGADEITYSYADIVDAIHIVQDNMGITGTTAKEASETISGSVASMKAAWENLVTGIADDNADFDALMTNMVDSVKTVAKNILPRVSTALSGIGKLIEGLAPVIVEALPVVINEVLPGLLETAGTLVTTLANAILENLPAIFDLGLDLIMMLANGLIENIPAIFDTLTQVIMAIVTKLTDGDTVAELVVASIKILTSLATGILTNLPKLIAAIPQIIASIVEGLIEHWPEIKQAGIDLLNTIINGLDSVLGSLLDAAGRILNQIKAGIEAGWEALKGVGQRIIDGILEGLKAAWDAVKTWFSNAVAGLTGKAKVEVATQGSHAGGLDYVPYNNYAANLHKGEAVLTRSEAEEWRRGGGKSSTVVVNVNAPSVDQATVDYIIQQANIRLGAMA